MMARYLMMVSNGVNEMLTKNVKSTPWIYSVRGGIAVPKLWCCGVISWEAGRMSSLPVLDTSESTL
jgi:hypothetical protein